MVAWNIRTGRQFVREAAHESDVHSVSVKDEVVVSGSRDGTAKVGIWFFILHIFAFLIFEYKK